MAIGTYGAYIAPPVLAQKGYLVKPEYSVIFGGTVSGTYAVSGVPVGTTGGSNLGLVEAFGFNINTTVTAVTGANVLESGIYEITAEECTISVTMKEWNLDLIKAVMMNGASYSLNDGSEALLTWGGGNNFTYYPLQLNFANKSINAPSSVSLANDITGGIATFYNVICTTGLNMDQLQANENKPLALEFRAVRDTTRLSGAQTGSLWLY